MRKLTSLATAAAVVVTAIGFSATPAEARHRHGGWGYRDRDRVSAGDVIGGLLIIGTIAAIAGAASKDKRDRRDRDERYDPPPYRDRDYRDTPRYERDDRSGQQDRGAYGRSEAEARAADACGWAVEAEMGDDARVDTIGSTERNGDGWYVTGTASRLGGEVCSFGCSYRNGRVVDVSFG
ncbi:MAG: hypothetical protein U0S50_07205 [Sphingopyxis sp.]|uniref:hypothetical protein n=1 Tax=Sphingopyxis sp. TaxID=1908224 RepID=UPI002ABC6752|nr:hypothetical protein [Sphingopyxis sp.]MDZ3831588.1 hypothetical protein [Sphingopyxis sp.]